MKINLKALFGTRKKAERAKKFILNPDEGHRGLMENLPRVGQIIDRKVTKDGIKDWFVMEFEEPFEYQKEVKENKEWKLISVAKVLVRSRWENCPIGITETACFILIPPDEKNLQQEVISTDDFYFDGWGMIKQIGCEQDAPRNAAERRP